MTLSNEVVDGAHRLNKELLLLFKVDFKKAYYFVYWGYLDSVMVRMSFPFLWWKWIKECISTATALCLLMAVPLMSFL